MRPIAALILILATACATTQPDPATTVRQLERAWLDAYEARDAEAMQRIVADGFTITFPDGSMQTKTDVVEAMRRGRASGGTSPKFHTESVQAHAYGNVVVLTGIVVTERSDGSRVPNRYTDTYVRFGNEWRVVSSHLSNSK